MNWKLFWKYHPLTKGIRQMSYCRFGEESDLYLFMDVAGGWCCMSCKFKTKPGDPDDTITNNVIATLAHVIDHVKAGHKVRHYTINRLLSEIIDYDAD